jgi:tetratricopeptide (TPR) repeat protein
MGMRRPTAAGRAALNLAALLARTGDTAGSVAALQTARGCGVPELSAQASMELAVSCQQAGDIEMAMRYYLEAASSPVPDVAIPATFVLGDLLREHEQWDEARMALESVVTSGHKLVPIALVQLGLVHVGTGNPGEAALCFRSAAQSGDAYAAEHATLQLGLLAYRENRLEEAADLLGKAARSADDEVRTRAADALRKLRAAP